MLHDNCIKSPYTTDTCKKGVCLSNDSVGNDWIKTYEMDGDIITSGKQITVPLDSKVTKTINATIIEREKHSDRSSKNIDITIEDKENITSTITVVENNGRFKGNRAIWQIDISVEFIKKIII